LLRRTAPRNDGDEVIARRLKRRRGDLVAHAAMSCRIVVALALLAFASPGFAQDKLRVVTSSADLKSLAQAVGGTRVEVESLAAPEQDPHGVEVKPAQLARVRNAALLIRIGLDHEPWLVKLKLPPALPVLDASRNVRLTQTETPRLRAERRAHVHAFGNTHYWLDPANALPITSAIRDALVKVSPGDARLFEENRARFTEELERNIARWKSALAPYRGSRLVVVHDSWSYFAEAFGLQIVAAAEPQPGVPPSPAELAALFQRMRESGVRLLIADPHSNPSLVRQIVDRTGARAVTLIPSGNDYVALLEQNVSRLAAALKTMRPD
jgi:ABC-type Zn uptake system ZnuABC Zn-binding protein ZnuA